MLRLALFATSAVGLSAGAALAQDKIFSETELSYSSYEVFGYNLETTKFSIAAGYQFGALTAVGQIDYQDLQYIGDDIVGLSAQLDYAITPNFSAGLDYANFELGENTNEYFEVSGTYDAGSYWASLFYGSNSEGSFLADEYYGVVGGYDFGQGTEVGLGFYTSDDDEFDDFITLNVLHQTETLSVEIALIDTDMVTIVNSETTYSVTPQIDVLFDLDVNDYSFNETVTVVGLGGAYEIAPGVSAYGKVSRISSGDFEIDGFTVGITYDTGTKSLRNQGTYDRILDPVLYEPELLIFTGGF